jgi:hypothetical protein
MAGATLRPLARALTDAGLRTTTYRHRLVMHATRVALQHLAVHGVRDKRGPWQTMQAIQEVGECRLLDQAVYDAMKKPEKET